MALPNPGTYQVDPVHSQVGFVVRHLVASKVRGVFTDFSGEITIADSAEASAVRATVQAASITTNNEMRDGHLKSADFLDLENHPTLELASKSISAKGGDKYALVADLTIRGVTKEVTFDLEFLGSGPGMAPNTEVAGFEATVEIDRRDFGANFEGTLENGSLVVANKVTIHLEIEAVKEG